MLGSKLISLFTGSKIFNNIKNIFSSYAPSETPINSPTNKEFNVKEATKNGRRSISELIGAAPAVVLEMKAHAVHLCNIIKETENFVHIEKHNGTESTLKKCKINRVIPLSDFNLADLASNENRENIITLNKLDESLYHVIPYHHLDTCKSSNFFDDKINNSKDTTADSRSKNVVYSKTTVVTDTVALIGQDHEDNNTISGLAGNAAALVLEVERDVCHLCRIIVETDNYLHIKKHNSLEIAIKKTKIRRVVPLTASDLSELSSIKNTADLRSRLKDLASSDRGIPYYFSSDSETGSQNNLNNSFLSFFRFLNSNVIVKNEDNIFTGQVVKIDSSSYTLITCAGATVLNKFDKFGKLFKISDQQMQTLTNCNANNPEKFRDLLNSIVSEIEANSPLHVENNKNISEVQELLSSSEVTKKNGLTQKHIHDPNREIKQNNGSVGKFFLFKLNSKKILFGECISETDSNYKITSLGNSKVTVSKYSVKELIELKDQTLRPTGELKFQFNKINKHGIRNGYIKDYSRGSNVQCSGPAFLDQNLKKLFNDEKLKSGTPLLYTVQHLVSIKGSGKKVFFRATCIHNELTLFGVKRLIYAQTGGRSHENIRNLLDQLDAQGVGDAETAELRRIFCNSPSTAPTQQVATAALAAKAAQPTPVVPHLEASLLTPRTPVDDDGICELQIMLLCLPDSASLEDLALTLAPGATDNTPLIVSNSGDSASLPSLSPGDTAYLTLQVKLADPTASSVTPSLILNYRCGDNSHSLPLQAELQLYPAAAAKSFTNEFSRYAGGHEVKEDKMFFGREETIRRITQTLHDAPGRHYALYGQKRSGKSSVLFHLKKRLDEDGHLCLLFSMALLGMDMTPEALFLQVLRALDSALEPLRDDDPEIPDFAPHPRDFHNYDPDNPVNAFQHYLNIYRQYAKGNELLADRRLIILVDEFTYLYSAINAGTTPPSLLQQWKALCEQENLSTVIAGQDSIPAFSSEPYARDFFSGFTFERLSYLEEDAARALIEKPVWDDESDHSRYSNQAVDDILRYSACSPFYIQIICERLVENALSARRVDFTALDVDKAVRELASAEHPRALGPDKFNNLLSSAQLQDEPEYTPELNEQLLHALARRCGADHYCLRSAIASGIDITAPGTEARLLNRLLERDVLTVRERGTEKESYKIRVDLFRLWLLEH